MIVHWGMRKASRYTTHHPQITIVLRSPELKVLANDDLTHARLRAKYIDLSAYNVRFEVDADAWDLGGRIGSLL